MFLIIKIIYYILIKKIIYYDVIRFIIQTLFNLLVLNDNKKCPDS